VYISEEYFEQGEVAIEYNVDIMYKLTENEERNQIFTILEFWTEKGEKNNNLKRERGTKKNLERV